MCNGVCTLETIIKRKDVLELKAYSTRWTSGGVEKFRVGDGGKSCC